MTVNDIKNNCNLSVICGEQFLEREVEGCYIGDLLSWAMSRVHNKNLFVTVMGNVNTIAVAVLAEASAVILADGSTLDKAALDKAKEQNVVVLTTDKNAYEIATELVKIGI